MFHKPSKPKKNGGSYSSRQKTSKELQTCLYLMYLIPGSPNVKNIGFVGLFWVYGSCLRSPKSKTDHFSDLRQGLKSLARHGTARPARHGTARCRAVPVRKKIESVPCRATWHFWKKIDILNLNFHWKKVLLGHFLEHKDVFDGIIHYKHVPISFPKYIDKFRQKLRHGCNTTI